MSTFITQSVVCTWSPDSNSKQLKDLFEEHKLLSYAQLRYTIAKTTNTF